MFRLLWMYHQLDCASYMFFSVKQKILFDLYNFNAFYKLFKCHFCLTDIDASPRYFQINYIYVTKWIFKLLL